MQKPVKLSKSDILSMEDDEVLRLTFQYLSSEMIKKTIHFAQLELHKREHTNEHETLSNS